MIEHLIEFGLVTAPTGGLTYVTAFPYHVRRRHAEAVRKHADRTRQRCVTVWCACLYHGRWILWQATVFLPKRHVRHRGEDD